VSYRRWLKDAIRVAERAGWTVRRNGHVHFTSPDGARVSCSWSPSCQFAWIKVTRDLRRAGLAL
jgi:hypothetical protein